MIYYGTFKGQGHAMHYVSYHHTFDLIFSLQLISKILEGSIFVSINYIVVKSLKS